MAITNRISDDYGILYVTEQNADTKKIIFGSPGVAVEAAAAKQ
jgi:hypothetical protein